MPFICWCLVVNQHTICMQGTRLLYQRDHVMSAKIKVINFKNNTDSLYGKHDPVLTMLDSKFLNYDLHMVETARDHIFSLLNNKCKISSTRKRLVTKKVKRQTIE